MCIRDRPNIGLGQLLTKKKIKGLIGTYYNWNTEVADAYNAGEITVAVSYTHLDVYKRQVYDRRCG